MLYGLLLSLNVLVCAGLVLVVLLQRSEGGALGTGGGPAGMVSARGAGDLLTRTTWILFALFLGLSLSLTLIGAHDRNEKALLERMKIAPGAPALGGASAATPAPTGAPIAPLAPVGAPPTGLTPSSLPPAVAAPVAPPAPAPAARQEAAKPKPEAAKPEAPKPAPAKPAKAHSAAASPAASPTAASAAPVITPPPPKADSDAGKTSAP